MSQLVTGEAVALDLRLAAVPSRAVAAGIDAFAQLTVLLLFGGLAAAAGDGVSEAGAAALGIVAIVVVLIVYPVAFETLMRGRTPGKAAMGLRVVRDDGGPIGFRQAVTRGLIGGFVEKPGISVYLVAVVVSLVHPSGKRLGDLVAGTVVVNERVVRTGQSAAPVVPGPLVGWATTLELSGLPDALAEQVRQFLARQSELTDRAREDLGTRLVAAVGQVTAPPPPPGTPGWAYLSAVVAERRRREEQRYAPAAGRGWGSPPQQPEVQRYAPAAGPAWGSPPGQHDPASDQQPGPQGGSAPIAPAASDSDAPASSSASSDQPRTSPRPGGFAPPS